MPPIADQLVFLLTPQHTGTHFARLLLECHSRMAFCITESRRIDQEQRPNYRLAGNGDGPCGPPNERMLDDYITDHLHGGSTAATFVSKMRYCMSQRTERFGDRTVYEHVGRAATMDLSRLGIHLPEKQPSYLLFQGHCGPKYQQAAFDRSEFTFIVTLRHPLLAVISALRRAPDLVVAHNILAAYDIVLGLQRAYFLCTDLWQQQPARFLEVFPFLNLPIEDAPRQYVSLLPKVNETIPRGDLPPSSFQEAEQEGADARGLEILREAKELWLRQRVVHASLSDWWRRIRQLQLLERMRPFGYEL